MRQTMRLAFIGLSVATALAFAPAEAGAFCGFYVEGSGKQLTNEATQVVLMREGTRTVLSMQNSYQGPPEAFAMVVPVPVVLGEADVKTLPRDVFDRVDVMGAPRLVEYWEQDPCRIDEYKDGRRRMEKASASGAAPPRPAAKPDDLGVTIEAEFEVGEYQIVILSAVDSTGLDTWLRREQYQIPEGAEPLLRPYVEGGWKFFVAKVDPKKVTFDTDGRATLSPLRFHYDSDDFVLPVRLGLINSPASAAGKQDLIVHVLARGKRYEVANYPNAFIPTNLDLRDAAKDRFGEFYAALFDRTLEKHPRAVITEYAWDASTCDPCPGPTLTMGDMMTLGADVLDAVTSTSPAAGSAAGAGSPAAGPPRTDRVAPRRPPPRRRPTGFVLTRLHARYGAELSEDLVFREAAPVVGGREVRGADGALETGATGAGVNNFQARYAIRHEWTGPIECSNPVRGRWGGPPPGERYAGPSAGRDLAFAPRGALQLASMVVDDVPEVDVKAASAAPAVGGAKRPYTNKGPERERSGCGCQGGGGAPGGATLLAVLAFLMIRRKR